MREIHRSQKVWSDNNLRLYSVLSLCLKVRSGQSSASIRSDRGGGIVTVTEGTYTTNGVNSPAVYSTADITVNYAELISNSSEAVVVEGKNSVILYNCTVTGNMRSSM